MIAIDLANGNKVLLGDKQHIHRRRKFDNNKAGAFDSTIVPMYYQRNPDPVYFDIVEAVSSYMEREDYTHDRIWIPEQIVVPHEDKENVRVIETGTHSGQLRVRYEVVKPFVIKNPLSSSEDREFKLGVDTKSGWMPACIDPVHDNVWVTEDSSASGHILNAYICNGSNVTESLVAGAIVNGSEIKRSTVVMSRCFLSGINNSHITGCVMRHDTSLINVTATNAMFEQVSANACTFDSVDLQRSSMALSYVAQSNVADSEMAISNCIGVKLTESTRIIGSTLREVIAMSSTFLSSDLTLLNCQSSNYIEQRRQL